MNGKNVCTANNLMSLIYKQRARERFNVKKLLSSFWTTPSHFLSLGFLQQSSTPKNYVNKLLRKSLKDV